MDYQLLTYIQNSRPKGLDSFFQLISEQTTSITIGVITALIFLGLLMQQHKHLLMKGLKLLVVILLNATVVIILKILINRPRPFDTFEDIEKLTSGGSPSFPSGHASEVFALAFAMLFIVKNRVAFYIFLFWAILIAYSRISLGVHYPSDVLVGALIGTGMAYLVSKLFDTYLPEGSPTKNTDL